MNFIALMCDGDLRKDVRELGKNFTISDMWYLHNQHIKREQEKKPSN